MSINSYWNQEQWTEVLDDYIEMLLADLVARLTGDYAKEIDVYDDLQTQAIKIARYHVQRNHAEVPALRSPTRKIDIETSENIAGCISCNKPFSKEMGAMFNMMGSSGKYHAANYGQMNLMNELRKLWMEHLMWTRLFVVSALAELPDMEITTKRLLKNPSDFAKVMEIFYGRPKADTFRSLLEEHLKIAASIVDNAKKGNTRAVEQFSKLWYSNADRIAAFLAGINPGWAEDEWRTLLRDHLRMTADMVTARLAGEIRQGCGHIRYDRGTGSDNGGCDGGRNDQTV